MKFSSFFTRLKGLPSVALLAMACSAFGGVASAAPFTWAGSGSNSLWNTGSNWVGGTPASTGSNLIFSGALRTTNTNNLTLTTGSISFANTGSAATGFVLTGSNLGLQAGARISTAALVGSGTVLETIGTNLAMSGGVATLSPVGAAGRAHNLEISGNIINGTGTTGNGVVIASTGGAQVILSGSNSNQGTYTVNAGAILTTLGIDALSNQAVANQGTVNLNGTILRAGPLSGGGVFTSSTTGFHELKSIFTQTLSTFNGTITDGAGTTALTKDNVGGLTLTGNNTYTGPTIINGGNITLSGNGSIASASAVTVGASGTLNINRSVPTIFSNSLVGAGTVNLNNSAVRVDSSGGFSGAINVGSVVAAFTGNLGSAAVNIGPAGSLFGTGTIGNVTVAGDALGLSAGLSGTANVGKLSVGSMTYVTDPTTNSVVTTFNINGIGNAPGVAGTDYDTIVGTGALDYGSAGSNFVFDFTNSTAAPVDNWSQFKVLDFTGYSNIAGLVAAEFSTVGVGGAGGLYDQLSFTDAGNGIFVADAGNGQTVEFYAATGVLLIVPEPSSIILAGLGVGLAGFRTWRNRRLKAILNRAGSKA